MLRRVLTAVLCLLLVVASVDMAAPSAAVAIEPVTLTLGIVWTVATVAALVAAAETYEVDSTFGDACASVGVSVQEGTLVQRMLEYACAAALSTPSLSVVMRDGRLMKSAVSWLKEKGHWSLFEDSAASSTEYGGNTYWSTQGLWDKLGFSVYDDAYVQGEDTPNVGNYQSGSDLTMIPANMAAWPVTRLTNITSVPAGRDAQDVALVIERICSDAGFWVKGTGGGAAFQWGATQYRWTPTSSPLGSNNSLKCFICEDTITLGYGLPYLEWQTWHNGTAWVPMGLAAGCGSLSVNSFLLEHGEAQCLPASMTVPPLAAAPSPDWYQPTTLSYPTTIVNSAPAAAEFPYYPDRDKVPVYVPPAGYRWSDTADDGGASSLLEEAANYVGDQSEAAKAAADAMEGAGEGWPDVAGYLVDWLLTPVRWILNAMSASLAALSALMHYLANAWSMVTAYVASLFSPNPEYLTTVYGPRMSMLNNDARQRWPFFLSKVVEEVQVGFGQTGSAAPLSFTYTILGHQYTLDLRDGLEAAAQKRWALAYFVWASLAVALLMLLKPKVNL